MGCVDSTGTDMDNDCTGSIGCVDSTGTDIDNDCTGSMGCMYSSPLLPTVPLDAANPGIVLNDSVPNEPVGESSVQSSAHDCEGSLWPASASGVDVGSP